MAILNPGCGSNPMAGAVNIDIRPWPGVDVIADAGSLPFEDGAFTEVHSINPHGYWPISLETGRVLRVGGLLFITGASQNARAKPLTAAKARRLGFEVVQTVPIMRAHQFGGQRDSVGRPLIIVRSQTTTYRRLP